jgi:hypothetical protein
VSGRRISQVRHKACAKLIYALRCQWSTYLNRKLDLPKRDQEARVANDTLSIRDQSTTRMALQSPGLRSSTKELDNPVVTLRELRVELGKCPNLRGAFGEGHLRRVGDVHAVAYQSILDQESY